MDDSLCGAAPIDVGLNYMAAFFGGGRQRWWSELGDDFGLLFPDFHVI